MIYISNQDCNTKEGMSFGNSLNSSVSAPVDAMLAVVINSSYGASTFIARLISVRNLTVEFLHVANSVYEVIHSAGSHVFSLMCEDLSVDEKHIRFSMKHLLVLGVTSTVHPYKNTKFEVLFTLFDTKHV